MKDLQKEDKEIYELMLRSNGPAPDIEEISKDKVLDNFYERMGYAKYQIIQILLISFLNIAIGAESLFLNVIEIQLLEEWKLQMYEAALLISSFSFGIAVGGYLSGYISDNFGRRKALLYSTFITFLFTFASTFVNEFYIFTFMNLVISIVTGIAAITCNSYLIEWLPIKNRSLVMSYSQLYPLGMLLLNAFALLCIDNTNSMVHWRWLGRSLGLIFLVCFMILKYFCYESPKFYLSRKKFEEVFHILDKVALKTKIGLSDMEKLNIMEHAETEECHKIDTSYKELFKGVFLRISMVLICFRLLSSLLNYGSLFILPILLGQTNEDKHKLNQYDATLGFLYTNLITLPAPFVRGVMTEVKCLGRKYTVFICCILTLGGFVSALAFPNFLMISIGFARMTMTVSSGTLVIYNTEVFPTKIRTLAVGFISAVTRLGSISSPYVCFYLVEISNDAVFYCFICLIVVCASLTLLLPVETRGLSLDNMRELKQKIKEEDLLSSDSDQRVTIINKQGKEISLV